MPKTLHTMVFVIILIFLTAGIIFLVGYNKVLKDNKNLHIQIQAFTNHLKQLQTTEDTIKRFRHDYSNHISVVLQMLKNGKKAEAEEYLLSFTAPAEDIIVKQYSGNFAADAIISEKAEYAELNGISIDFKGSIPDKIIDNCDLCAILSNLIDNAIEYYIKTPCDNLIQIESIIHQHFLVLSVWNTIADDINAESLHSNKTDPEFHGIGLKTIKSLSKKYNGSFIVSTENNEFCATVRLTIPENKRT